MHYKPNAALVSITLLLVLLFFSFLYNLSAAPLHLWDESRRAIDALTMYQDGIWIIDHYDGIKGEWSTKSPLLIWMQVLSIKLFGISDASVRIPSALAAICIGICIWWFCKRHLQNVWMGFLAGSIFALSYPWVFNHAGRSADYDAFVSLFSLLYCISFYLYCVYQSNKWLRWFFVFLILAVLFKGVTGLFFVSGLTLFAILEKRVVHTLRNKWFYIGIACFVVIIGGYYWFREWHAPGYLWAMFVNELGGRYFTNLEESGQPFLYYAKNFFDWRYPFWKYFIIPAAVVSLFYPQARVQKFLRFSLLLALLFMLVISVSKTKLYWYDLPIYPFLSINLACFFLFVWTKLERVLKHQKLKIATAAILVLLLFIRPMYIVYINNIRQPQEWPWNPEEEERKQGFLLKQAMNEHQNLNGYVFCYTGQHNAHLRFYIRQLQTQNVQVSIRNNVQSLERGMHVVVSEDNLKKQLEENYLAQKLHEKFGCTVYFIQSRRSPDYVRYQ